MEGFNWSILAWIGGLVFVYFFGIFEGRMQGRKSRIAEEEQEKKEQPALTPDIVKVDDPGFLRIKNEQGNMTLDLDGKRVEPTSLSPEQRKRLIEILNAMRPWLEGKPTTPPATPPPPPTPAPVSPPTTSAAPQPVTSAPATNPKSTSPLKKKDEEVDAPTTMVGQINAILQEQIINTPLASQGVSLIEAPSGGVNVFVGVKRYEAIDDIPDDEIKTAIRTAIATWEKKYTPGMN